MFEVASFLFGLTMCVCFGLIMIVMVVWVVLDLIKEIRDFRD